MSDTETDDPSFEADERELCSDGACVGVVGPDRRCKVCGAFTDPGANDWSGRPAEDPVPTPGDTLAEYGDGVASESESASEPESEDDRQLCPDGACIGLIGADRRCKVCGSASP